MVNGKQKGASFERSICTQLSLWLTAGLSEDVFWRSAMSGGRATVAHKSGKANRQAGDICSVSPEGHRITDIFFIECKFVRKLQVDKFILLNEGPLAKFWTVCVEQASNHNRLPMIIAKENGRPPIVITQPHDIYKLCEAGTSFTVTPEIRLLSDVLNARLQGKLYDQKRVDTQA